MNSSTRTGPAEAAQLPLPRTQSDYGNAPAEKRHSAYSEAVSRQLRRSTGPSLDGLFDIDNAWVSVWTEEDGRFEISLEGFNHLVRVTRVGYTAENVRLRELPDREELVVEMVRKPWFREGLQ